MSQAAAASTSHEQQTNVSTAPPPSTTTTSSVPMDLTLDESVQPTAATVNVGQKRAKRGRGGRGGGRGGGGRARGDSFNQDDSDMPMTNQMTALPALPQTPIQQQFALFANYLDARNDRRELIYQSSRDLTRSSKKLISQLQRMTYAHTNPTEKATILTAAHTSLRELHQLLSQTVADFNADDFHRYSGAFSPGFQEFIESASLLYYLEHGSLITHQEIEKDIETTIGKRIEIPLSDYIVGILDLGGELMRYATNSVTSGNHAIVNTICVFLRDVYAEYQKLSANISHGGPFKELNKKLEVWLQSLMKIEALCYKLHIRGAEFPDHRILSTMLMNDLNSLQTTNHERDETNDNRRGEE